MMNMDSFKKKDKGEVIESNSSIVEEVKQDKQEKKENSSWNKVKLGFAKYLTKIFTEYGKLDYVKPLSFLVNQKAEIERNKQKFKMLPVEEGGPTKEQMYATALKVAKQFGWDETPPQKSARVFEMGYEPVSKKDEEIIEKPKEASAIFDSLKNGVPSQLTRKIESEMKTAGITEDELHKLPIGKLWELFQQKVLEKEIKEPKKEKIYTVEEVSEDFSMLQQIWEESYDNMENALDDKKANEVISITANNNDPKILEEYLKSNPDLEPEAKFFIEMSINVKKFKAKGKELLGAEEVEQLKNAA